MPEVKEETVVFLKKEKHYKILFHGTQVEVMKYWENDEYFGNYDCDWNFLDEEKGRAWYEMLDDEQQVEFDDFISDLN